MNMLTPSFDVFDDTLRMKRLNGLRHRLGLAAFEDIVQSEPDVPSLGIEIELTWDQAIPELREQWLGNSLRPASLNPHSRQYKEFRKLYAQGHRRIQQQYRKIKDVFPQVSEDAYKEFSFNPSRNVRVIASEVETLYDMDILTEGTEYSTHLTISDVTSDYDAYALLCLLEMNGGTTVNRITAPSRSRTGSWAQKGAGGILKRRPEELIGGTQIAYELRSLVTTDPEQLASVLETAQNTVVDQNHHREKWELQRRAIKKSFEAAGLIWTDWDDPRQPSEIWNGYAASGLIKQ
jgi:hypothetical protein